MLGCFKPHLGKIWTNPNVGLTFGVCLCTALIVYCV